MLGRPHSSPTHAGIVILCFLCLAGAVQAQDGEAGGTLARARELALAGRHAEAVPLYRQVAAEIEQKEGAEAWPLVFLLHELGVQHHMVDALGEADSLYRRSMAIAESHRGPRDRALVPGLRGLATIAATRGQMADAESLYRRALEIQQASDDSQAAIAQTLSELGLLSQLQGLPEEAEKLYRRALEIATPDHLPQAEIAIISGNLGGLLDDQERYAEAEPFFRSALAIRERLLGPDHPDLARAHETLGRLRYRQGRFAEALSSYQESLRIREQAGLENLAIAEVLGSIAACHRQLGRPTAAEAHFRMAQTTLDTHCRGRERTQRCRDAIRVHQDLKAMSPSATPAAAPPSPAPPPPATLPASSPPPSAAPPASPPPPATAGVRAHRVQVGAREDPREAAENLAQLLASHPQFLDDVPARIMTVDLGDRGVWHRVQIGEFQRLDEAKDFCLELVRRGHEGCWVITTED